MNANRLVWCPRCLADAGDSECCTPQRLARIHTVPAKRCGCLVGDDCGCVAVVEPAPMLAGTALHGRRP